jgi:plastocyanin
MNQPCPNSRLKNNFKLLAVLCIALLVPTLPSALAQMEPGLLTVQVFYRGAIPQPTDTIVTRDPDICGTTVSSQSVEVHSPSGGLKDAVVMIEGLHAPGKVPAQIPPMALLNSRCSFSPHVMAIQTGSALEIHNLDPVPHNTHITSGVRTFVNVAMVVNARAVGKKVSKSGLYLVQCDAHKFMRGYVMAFEHPYFSVTDGHGDARILNVPPGEHNISVWHERLGQLQAHVTVPSNGEAVVTFEFRQDGADGGLRMNR